MEAEDFEMQTFSTTQFCQAEHRFTHSQTCLDLSLQAERMHNKGSITPDVTLKNASLAKPLIPYGTARLSDAPFKCRAVRFSSVFQACLKVKIFSTFSARRGGAPLINVTLGQGSQSDQARGGLSFLFSRRDSGI